ncbi:hypothetical protein ACFVV6_13635 [Bacillus mycoides]|jgi:GH24 family phage-related lysozyme (muramidase)|uniref:Phr family secreted Rap phosphatase inhibitor n=4 Tax=Bacillus cereus group TaxID=86661 RepID=R8D380_BACCE|nr:MULTISPECIES: hypothetical protein [Bacillus]RAN90560.1 hypothetical protein B5P41_05965 [Bacillus sp. SRB_28]EJP99545.1 hypothetical protein IC3_00341 [Bacillus cereus VD142]EJR35296.1 hypothetical protein IIG_01915 [Bacillus cereus VD048]EJR42041.1 hypothetical protein III_02468 [Bacillus mycoides]EJV84573.1 hypothetical protein IG3_02532 [Bacillus cereus HuA2-1]
MIKKVKMFLMGIVFIGTVAFGGSQFIQYANRGDTPAPARDFIQYANRGDTPAPVIPTYTKSSHDSLNLS